MQKLTLKNETLKALSFYEPMELDKIFLDLDKVFVEENPQLTFDDLKLTLEELVKEKKVRLQKQDGHSQWIRVFPKKTILEKIKNFFSTYYK